MLKTVTLTEKKREVHDRVTTGEERVCCRNLNTGPIAVGLSLDKHRHTALNAAFKLISSQHRPLGQLYFLYLDCLYIPSSLAITNIYDVFSKLPMKMTGLYCKLTIPCFSLGDPGSAVCFLGLYYITLGGSKTSARAAVLVSASILQGLLG